MDTFVLYNGGFKVLNNLVPFKDYWLVTGPLMDYLNALIFKINGVSWRSYIIHSSFLNGIVSIILFHVLKEFNLKKIFCFFYSLMFSVLMYPSAGVPFVDHHATILVIISFCFFILGIKKRSNLYFFLVPLFLVLAFLCKQTPTFYGIVLIFFLGLFYLIKNNNKKNFLFSIIAGSFFSLIFIFFFFFFTKIPISNFLEQYVLFARTVGTFRLSNWGFDIIGIIHQYKFIFLPLIFIFYFLYNAYLNKNNDNFLILLSLIFLVLLLIVHQILTSNENYIFFLIPIITSFIHIFGTDQKKIKNIVLYSLILLCIFSVTKYHLRFNEHRKFHNLEKVDLKKAIDGNIIDKQLQGLKWISKKFEHEPNKEVSNIIQSLEILRKEKGDFAIITSYLFIAPVLGLNDNSPNQWYHPGVSFPLRENKYFLNYKEFFIKKLRNNKIKKIIVIGNELEEILDLSFSKDCFNKTRLGEITIKFEISNKCKFFYENT